MKRRFRGEKSPKKVRTSEKGGEGVKSLWLLVVGPIFLKNLDWKQFSVTRDIAYDLLARRAS